MTKHTAPGQMAGYLFQPERALYWLARTETRCAQIGLETGDDVEVIAGFLDKGQVILESDKHTITAKKTFNDKSEDLWKTLFIWLEKIVNKVVDPTITLFIMVTNIEVENCLASKLGKENKTNEYIDSVLIELKNMAKEITGKNKEYSDYILSQSDIVIKALINSLRIIDNSQASNGFKLYENIASLLHIPIDLDSNSIIEELFGWIHFTVLSQWRSKQNAFITRQAFDKKYSIILSRYRTKAFKETARSLISITDEQRTETDDMVFLKQIELICDNEQEQQIILDAIDDFLCFKNEIIRLATNGNISKEELVQFKDRLRIRWDTIFKSHCIGLSRKTADEIREVGLRIYYESLLHREMLAGQVTEEYYLTRGGYHSLSEILEVGWHPNFNKIISRKV